MSFGKTMYQMLIAGSQAYAKWERGLTIPDIEKAAALAKVYGITINNQGLSYDSSCY